MSTSGSAARAGRREWLGLAALALPTLVVSIDIGVLFLALPQLSADLGASGVQQLWIADIYGFLMAGFLVTMGSLGDRIGRRKLLLIGVSIFGVLSILAAYSSSAEMLIACRALMGIAGATLMPSTLALISNMFRDDGQRRTAIAAWMSCMMLGSALGPVVGGLLLAHFWWGSVFLLGVPVAVLLVVAGPILLPEYRNADSGKLDPLSVVLSLLTILPVIYGVKELAADDVANAAIPVGSIVVGVIFGVVFVRRQLHLPAPLIELKLFRDHAFSATLTSQLTMAGAMAGLSLLISQYLQSVLEFSPTNAGLLMVPLGVAVAVGSQLSQLLVRWMSNMWAIVSGLLFAAAGFVLVTQADPNGGPVLIIVGGTMLHLGAGPLFALGANLVVGSVPPERAGSAASLSETSNIFGSTLGLAVIGTIGAAVYRFNMADVPVPDEHAEAARATVAGANAAAKDLPNDVAADILGSAHQAYTTSVQVGATVGAVLIASLVVLIIRAFRANDRRLAAEAAATAAEEGNSSSTPTGTSTV